MEEVKAPAPERKSTDEELVQYYNQNASGKPWSYIVRDEAYPGEATTLAAEATAALKRELAEAMKGA